MQVTDEAGNQAFSPVNTSLTVSGAQLGNLAGAGGYQVGLFGINVSSGNLNAGADLAVDGASQTAYVTDNNNQRIRVVLPDRTQNDLRDTTGQTYNAPQTPQGIAIAPGGDLFISRWNAGSINWIPPSLPVNPAMLVNGLLGPSRLVFDARPTTPVVCAAKTGGLQSMNCYGFSSAGTGSLTKQFNNDLIPSPAPSGHQHRAGRRRGRREGRERLLLHLPRVQRLRHLTGRRRCSTAPGPGPHARSRWPAASPAAPPAPTWPRCPRATWRCSTPTSAR